MQLTTDQSINLALTENIHQLNQSFVTDAIKEWDRIGQGCFALFIELYVNQVWLDMTQKN